MISSGPNLNKEIIILGPTASGKTKLAVELAHQINGAIISADSRQVYRGLDLGTGKDLAEYGKIPYYLIDIVNAGEKYNISRFLRDAEYALNEIRQKGRTPIICGGTGHYLQGLIQGYGYSEVPKTEEKRIKLELLETGKLREILQQIPKPKDYKPDFSTRKRIIRAIEICEWLLENPNYTAQPPLCPHAQVYGVAPALEERRQNISRRLKSRIEQGMIDEVHALLENGLEVDQLIYYGLEYKYIALYLTGQLSYQTFYARLETEIHRYAKRQMTYFRKMEKDGVKIHWLSNSSQSIPLDF